MALPWIVEERYKSQSRTYVRQSRKYGKVKKSFTPKCREVMMSLWPVSRNYEEV